MIILHKDSEKLIVFRKLLQVFSQNEVLKKVEDDILLKGNLAYFIDGYIDSEEWNELFINIIEGVKSNAFNEICYMIYIKIQTKRLKELSEKNSASQMKIIKDLMIEMSKTFELQYKKGRLKNFVVVSTKSYPDWYIAYERFIQDSKK